jgi:hypothetical protein
MSRAGHGLNAIQFFGSALALANPVPLPGNKIALLENGDEYFPGSRDAQKK